MNVVPSQYCVTSRTTREICLTTLAILYAIILLQFAFRFFSVSWHSYNTEGSELYVGLLTTDK